MVIVKIITINIRFSLHEENFNGIRDTVYLFIQ